MEGDELASSLTSTEARPPSRSRRRAERPRRSIQTKLAGAVGRLSEIEEEITAHMLAAEQLVRRLEVRGVHKGAGYSSRSDFEQRILSSTPIIKAMRISVAAAEPRKAERGAAAPKGHQDTRSRRTQALESVAQALVQLRGLDVAIHRAALSARATLGAIESDRLFEECGYPSFEEFLERALGPSPVLAAAMALAELEPAPEPEESLGDEHDVADVAAEGGFDDIPNFMNEPLAEAAREATADVVARSVPALAAAPSPKFSAKQAALSVALCIAATFFGGAAGSWSAFGSLMQSETKAAAEHSEPSAAPVHPATPAKAPSASALVHPAPIKAAPAAPDARLPQPARTREVDPLSVPIVVRARTAGPREARR